MINYTEERILSFFESLSPEMPKELYEFEQNEIKNHIPIIRKEAQSFLRFLFAVKTPKRILELGTATGFSAVFMKSLLPSETYFRTVERNEERRNQALYNIKRFEIENIDSVLGDCFEEIESLKNKNEKFDFIFLDAAKAQYINLLPGILEILEDNGVLLTDNILQEGSLLDSKFIIERRDRTIHIRMREYLQAITHNDLLDTTLFPLADGIALSIKKKKQC
ncbi:MAG: O-methyltransferase [Lachnospiraceae bacterium]|nr:O-methyltransferase [Lachnospiraceae bacterium]